MSEEGKPTHLDLFSGIGGFALAAQWAGFRTIAFCEIDKYCQKLLAKNFLADSESERWRERRTESNGTRQTGTCTDSVPIFSDIFNFDGTAYRGVDLITGGFPCQPFSCAGKRRGKEDDRHLWPEMLRVIKEARPAWVLGENVAGIIGMELDAVLSDLETIGYATRSFIIPAYGVDARHRRNRVWIVAKSNAERCGRRSHDEGQITPKRNWPESAGVTADAEPARLQGFGTDSGQSEIAELGNGSALADAASERLEGFELRKSIGKGSADDKQQRTGDYCRWLPEPDVGRVAHGIPSRVDRLRGLGNAIVPQVAFEILKEIRSLI